jgi:hypothetical protein
MLFPILMARRLLIADLPIATTGNSNARRGTPMKVLISVIWFAFALLFFMLGRDQWLEAQKSMPPFEIPKHAYELSGSGFHLEIDVRGTPLDQPFENFAEEFNAYLEKQNQSSSTSNRRAAWAYFLASGTAIVSLLLELRGGVLVRSQKASEPTV